MLYLAQVTIQGMIIDKSWNTGHLSSDFGGGMRAAKDIGSTPCWSC